jgi:hypothetical protein
MSSIVRIKNKNAIEAIDVVRELREKGYTQGIDFDFEYHHHESVEPWASTEQRHTLFTFYKEELATWFSLKYL